MSESTFYFRKEMIFFFYILFCCVSAVLIIIIIFQFIYFVRIRTLIIVISMSVSSILSHMLSGLVLIM